MEIKKGDRIELLEMRDDPCAIEPGAKGTVTEVFDLGALEAGSIQVWVKWDNGRNLAVVLPHDRIKLA